MDSGEKEKFGAFQEKVKRTIYVDNLSPLVTEAVLKASFNQFGNVKSIKFIPNYLGQKGIPKAALIEMSNPKQAQEIIVEMANYPLMISGMPRPVRSRPAKLEMFDDRPRLPGRRLHCRWVDPKEPEFEVARKIKNLVRKHAAESAFVLERQVAEEEKLHIQQSEILKGHYKKFELIDRVFEDGSAQKLERRYKPNAW